MDKPVPDHGPSLSVADPQQDTCDKAASRLHRWLILTQYYPPEMGAPQIRLRCFARELRQRGIEVSVLTAMPNYPLGKVFKGYEHRWCVREQIDGIEVTRLWGYAATGRAAAARIANYCGFALAALPTIFRRNLPHVLFVESQPLPVGIVALFMKWFRGVPYIYNVPDLQVQAAQDLGFLRGPVLKAALWFEDLLLKQAWKISTVTNAFIQHFRARGVPLEKITFLPNGADTEFLKPLPPSPEFLDRWQLRGKKVIVAVGTMTYYQALDTIVEAAERLASDSEIVLLMVGDGPERERIQRLVQSKGLSNVIFSLLPYEENDQLYSIAHAALATLRDVPIAASSRPSKLFPPLSCGVPVIYSGTGEAAQLVENHCCGVAVPPEDPDALAQAIRELVNDPERRQRLGRNGRLLAESRYSWFGIVEHWLNELLNSERDFCNDVQPLSEKVPACRQ